MAPDEQPHESRACDGALAKAFGCLGKRWNGLLLATLMDGPMGFSDLRRAVGSISDSVLSDRLGELGTAGLVARTVDEGPPTSVQYSLTKSGRALSPSLQALTDWASKNL
ncbi:helix-turn-helix domain-containing protein [Rhodococcus sp. KRD162]|uniref:winged helix-turn-helix transcriptional regulator n=1 Tax=unclassified Rhodococcus (in: high G+C Gram-positive bacteria) TaxID=192944 RepID=UPI0019CF4F7B|nr:helix-turn-helix domain-containing protein [Rhodococcus sp. KRD162]